MYMYNNTIAVPLTSTIHIIIPITGGTCKLEELVNLYNYVVRKSCFTSSYIEGCVGIGLKRLLHSDRPLC